jgi:acetyl esterase/lipase
MIEKRLRHFKYFTDRGQTVFLVIHGSAPKFLVNEVIQDVHRAVRFVRYHAAKYGVDPNRLGVSGMSSGGHLSLSIGTGLGKPSLPATSNDPIDQVSSQVQAVACFFPPADLVNFGSPELLFVEQEHLKRYRSAFAVDTKTREEQRKLMQELSPIYAVSKQTPPVLLLHGTQDTIVPLEQSQRFIARVKEMGVPAQLIIHQGGEHGWTETWESDLNILADWFEKYLLGAK